MGALNGECPPLPLIAHEDDDAAYRYIYINEKPL